MDGILGKSKGEYINVIKLPLIAWISFEIIVFTVGILFTGTFAAASSTYYETGGISSSMVFALGVVELLVNVFAGIWLGWRTVKLINGSYGHAAVTATITVVAILVLNVAVSTPLSLITMDALFSVLGVALLAAYFLISFIIMELVAVVSAFLGVFLARVMKGR